MTSTPAQQAQPLRVAMIGHAVMGAAHSHAWRTAPRFFDLPLARDLVADGRLGRIYHVRAQYLQDWIVDPEFPLVWRLQKDKAGSGALGDIGAHVIDLAHYVTGHRLGGVSAATETFVKRRPLPGASSGLAATGAGGQQTGEVTVDDATALIGRTDGG